VEFDLGEGFNQPDFDSAMAAVAAQIGVPDGRMARIVGSDGSVGRVIEVWATGRHARTYAERIDTADSIALVPFPSRVAGFEADCTMGT
jgi:hypothetical protein